MKCVEYCDMLGSRSRSPFLLLVAGDTIFPFEGKNIPGIVVILGTDYERNGKWSGTTFRLQIPDHVRTIIGRSGWETGRFVEGLGAAVRAPKIPDTWQEVADAIGVSVPSTMEFLRSWRPKAAEKLDHVEQALIDLEEASSRKDVDSLVVTVSFGRPTNAQRQEGFWESPKAIPGYNAEIRLKDRNHGWREGNIEVVGIAGTVVSVMHAPGLHGGYYSVSVAVMPTTETAIPSFESTHHKVAQENGVPVRLCIAFNGDVDRVKAFMGKVAQLDTSLLDEHEMSCGRARKKAEVIRVSGDADFFMGADPLDVCWFIVNNESVTKSLSGSGDTALGHALRKAGLA